VVPSVIRTANQEISTSFPAPPFTARVKVKVVELVMTPVVRYRDSTPFTEAPPFALKTRKVLAMSTGGLSVAVIVRLACAC